MGFKRKRELPILNKKEEILSKIQLNQCVIIVSETGSGKTTQVPQYLYQSGMALNGIIGVTQPRRVAAVTVSNRVSEEMECSIGSTVGYKIRFEDMTSPKTKIQYMTDGMLLREYMNDQTLKKFSAIILDEAHERTLNTEILLALTKKLLTKRPNLKVIIMSATLSTKKFSRFFNDAPVVESTGRMFNVKEMFLSAPENNCVDASVTTVLQIHISKDKGHILVFFSGQEEIERAKLALKKKIKNFPCLCSKLKIYPIYAALPTQKQIEVFWLYSELKADNVHYFQVQKIILNQPLLVFEKVPFGTRKIILATNIAETSITIEGIVFVVDCGFSKKRHYNFKNGIDVMVNDVITRSEANQRKGRAGRVSNGICYRLYTENIYKKMNKDIVPEILRTNLSNIIIFLKHLGIKRLSELSFMDSPDIRSLNKSCKILLLLGAIDKDGKLTTLGKKICFLPIESLDAITLIKSKNYNAQKPVLTIIAFLAVESIWINCYGRNKKMNDAKRRLSKNGTIGDMLTSIEIYNEYKRNSGSKEWCNSNSINRRAVIRAIKIRNQLKTYMKKMKIWNNEKSCKTGETTVNTIRKALGTGFFVNLAILQSNGDYKTLINHHIVKIHPSSVLHNKQPKCVLFGRLIKTKSNFIKNISIFDHKWLGEVAPQYFQD